MACGGNAPWPLCKERSAGKSPEGAAGEAEEGLKKIKMGQCYHWAATPCPCTMYMGGSDCQVFLRSTHQHTLVPTGVTPIGCSGAKHWHCLHP